MRPTNSPKASLLLFSFALGLLLFLSPAHVSAQVPDGYMSCALEGERCQFEGTKEVLYGFGTQFSRKTATGFIECSVNGFGGDPAPNIRKKCYIPYNPQTDSPGIQRYNYCGMEGERCKFYGQRKVMYG